MPSCLLHPDIGAVDGSGQTALHLSVEQRKAQAVALLLERGSSPNAQDKQVRLRQTDRS